MTAVDCGHREAPQLKVGFLDAGAADDVHPQTHAHLSVIVAEEAFSAVGHVVHAHDRGRTECCVECLR